MLLIQCNYGCIHLSKVKNMDYQCKIHWNFVQSSIRMQVERTIGMLKGRFVILLKKIDIPLRHMLDLVMICICLHMCVINSDYIDVDWALEAQRNAQIETNTRFLNLN